jgi:FtsZ-interacting cell division protein YlmF
MNMKSFSDRFISLFEADEVQPTTDQEAANQQLQTTDVKELGATPGSDTVSQAKKQSQTQQLVELESWIGRIDEFINYLNGVNADSIQTKLHSANCDSLFEKIARSETKKIARVAVDLSSLAESFKGYLIAGSNDNA